MCVSIRKLLTMFKGKLVKQKSNSYNINFCCLVVKVDVLGTPSSTGCTLKLEEMRMLRVQYLVC